MFSKILFVLSALSAITSALPHVERAANVVPFSAVGGIGAVQAISSDTRLYFQNKDGSINEYSVSNAFNAGQTTGNITLVPAGQAQLGTPIIHVYFFSPSNILSEWIWKNGIGWRGGPSCTECLTTSGLAVTPGSKVLYAMGNPSTGSLRVGFESAGFPGTLAEADKSADPSGVWQLAALPN